MAYEYGLTVHCVPCDGTTSYLECMPKFECRIGSTLEDLDGKFELNNEKLFFTPDACHMLKPEMPLLTLKRFTHCKKNISKVPIILTTNPKYYFLRDSVRIETKLTFARFECQILWI